MSTEIDREIITQLPDVTGLTWHELLTYDCALGEVLRLIRVHAKSGDRVSAFNNYI